MNLSWKHCFAAFLSASFVASLLVNVWLILKVLDYKGRLLIAREFPDQVSLKVHNNGGLLVWMIGDSRMAAWTIADAPNRKCVNRGVGGFTARESLDQLRSDLAVGSKPDIAIIQVGINDVLSAGYNRPHRLPPGAFTGWSNRPGPTAIIEECVANLNNLIETARIANIQVILLTILPPGPIDVRDKLFWSIELDNAVIHLNNKIRTMKSKRVEIFDPSSLLSTGNRIRSDYAMDTFHLNDKGNALISGELERILNDYEASSKNSKGDF